MLRADVSIHDVLTAAANAQRACEERDARDGVGRTAPSLVRENEMGDILRRLPEYLRQPTGRELLARIKDGRLVHNAAKWWHWERGNLLLMGPSGVGKSTAAAFIVRRMVAEAARIGGWEWNDAKRIYWFAAPALELARKQHPLGQGDAPDIDRACRARLLVLDDMGWDRDPQAVSWVLDQRMQSGRQTIITSGRTPEELTAHYGSAVTRRMTESGGKQARIVDCFPKPNAAPELDRKSVASGGD